MQFTCSLQNMTLVMLLTMQLAWLGGKRRQNRLKAAAHTRAARLGSGAPDGLGRIPAPLQHRAWLQEHDSQAVNIHARSVAFPFSCQLHMGPRLMLLITHAEHFPVVCHQQIHRE
jgi:hypothetical protein